MELAERQALFGSELYSRLEVLEGRWMEMVSWRGVTAVSVVSCIDSLDELEDLIYLLELKLELGFEPELGSQLKLALLI